MYDYKNKMEIHLPNEKSKEKEINLEENRLDPYENDSNHSKILKPAIDKPNELFITAMSHLLLFLGFTIIMGLIAVYPFKYARDLGEYGFAIYLTFFVYSVSAMIVGKIGLNVSKNHQKSKILNFLCGVCFLSIFNICIVGVNFYREIDKALSGDFDQEKYNWQVKNDEIWLNKQQNFFNVLKWNTIISVMCLFIHYFIIIKTMNYYKLLSVSQKAIIII